MKWEHRCLVCDYMWDSDSCTDSCSEYGETDDIYSEEAEDYSKEVENGI